MVSTQSPGRRVSAASLAARCRRVRYSALKNSMRRWNSPSGSFSVISAIWRRISSWVMAPSAYPQSPRPVPGLWRAGDTQEVAGHVGAQMRCGAQNPHQVVDHIDAALHACGHDAADALERPRPGGIAITAEDFAVGYWPSDGLIGGPA